MATPQKTRGIKHHPPLSDSDRGGLVLDTFGICLWREQGRRAAPREKSVGRCARKWGVEERKDGVGRRAKRFRVGKLSASCGLARPRTAPFRTPARPSTNTKRPRGKARATKIRTTHLFQGADHFQCRSLRPQTIYLTIYLRAQTISIVHFRGCRPFPKWAFTIYNCPQTIPPRLDLYNTICQT